MKPPKRGRPVGQTGKAPTLKPEEIRRLFRVAKSRTRCALRAEAAVAVSFFLGLRAKEIASLRYGDVFDREGTVRDVLHLKRSYTKGAKARDVYLSSDRLRQILSTYGKNFGGWTVPNAPLFKSQKGQHMTSGSMARFLKQLYTEAGLPDASSHTGRRTFITTLAEKGVDLKAISILAGHSNIRTTAMYVESNPVRLSRILGDVEW